MSADPHDSDDWEVGTPYPGLRPFERHEAVLFFGRDRCVDAMVETLQRKRFLAVLGASGSGKSSLVRTGLFEALEAGLAHIPGPRWTFADIRHPGGTPFRELARALFAGVGQPADPERVTELSEALRHSPRKLIDWWNAAERDPDDNLLILVDQFEELFRYRSVGQRDNVEAFVDLLLSAAGNDDAPIYVVLTMRSEYLGVCSLISGLAEQINHSLGLTPRMLREECEAAIVGPSRIAGFNVQPELVNTLLNDMNALAPWPEGSDDVREIDQAELIARRADQLPLMQHVLNLLWTKAVAAADSPEQIVLTLDAYRALGGLSGALTKHADEVMNSTGEPELTEAIFRALTEGVTIAGAVRRHRTIADLIAETGAPEARVRAVVDRFRAADANFLSPALPASLELGDSVDISHESLIRQWTRLSEWLKKEAEAGKTWRDLQRALDRKSTVGLIGDRLLKTNLDWMAAHRPTEAWARRYDGRFSEVQDFLAESEAEDARARRRKRLLRSAAITAIAFIPFFWVGGTSVAAWYADGVRAEAERDAQTALNSERQARLVALQRMQNATRASQAVLRRAGLVAEQRVRTAEARAQDLVAAAQRDREAARLQAEKMRTGAVLFARSSAELLRDSVAAEVEQAFQPGRPHDLVRRNFDRFDATLRGLMESPAASEVQGEADFAAQRAIVQLANAELHQSELRLEDSLAAARDAERIASGAARALRAEALAHQGRVLLMEQRNDEARPLFEQALQLIGPEPGGQLEPDMLRAAALAHNGLGQLAVEARRPEEAATVADRCLDLTHRFTLRGELGELLTTLGSDSGAGAEPDAAGTAPGPAVSANRLFEASLLCMTPLIRAAGEDDFEALFAARSRDVMLISMMNEVIVPTDLRLLRLWSEFLFRMSDAIPDSRGEYGRTLLEQYPQPVMDEASLFRAQLGDAGEAFDPSGEAFASWYLTDLLNYSRVRRMRTEAVDFAGIDHAQYLDTSTQLYNAIRRKLGAANGPFLTRRADEAAADFESQLVAIGPSVAITPGMELGRIRTEASTLRGVIGVDDDGDGAPDAVHPAISAAAARLIDLLARPETAAELRRYPNVEGVSRLLIADAEGICAALGRNGADPCAQRGLDLSTLDQAVQQEADTLAERQLSSDQISMLEVAFDGIDPVACIDDIENGRNLAAPEERADGDPPVCVLQRGFGSNAVAAEGKVWLFASLENRPRFLENPQLYVPDSIAQAAPAVRTTTFGRTAGTGAAPSRMMFGRLIDGRLRLYVSYHEAVDDHGHEEARNLAP